MLNKKIFKLAIPSIIENILHIMLSTVDTYFVASLGAISISAVGINTLISNMYLTFFIAISTGVSILTARADGEGSIQKVNQAIQNGLLITGLIILFTFLINMIFGKTFITLLGKETPLIKEGMIYFSVVILPIGILCLMTVVSGIIKSLNDTKSPMYTVLFINIINIILDYILIVGVGDFKGIGILGAGIATTISRAVGLLILLSILNKKTRFIRGFEFKFKSGIKEMIYYSLPVGAEKIVMRIGQLFYGSLIVTIGIKHYAGHNIAGTIEAYSYLPGMGFGVASFALIGHAIGERDYNIIKKIGLLSYKYSTIFMIAIGSIFFIFAPNLAEIFTDDPEIIRLVTIVLRIIAFFQPFLCSTQVITASLQALGDVKYPLYLTFFGIWFIRLMGTYFIGIKLGYGLVGVWISYAIDVTFRGTLLFLRFHKKTKNTDTLEREYDHVSSS